MKSTTETHTTTATVTWQTTTGKRIDAAVTRTTTYRPARETEYGVEKEKCYSRDTTMISVDGKLFGETTSGFGKPTAKGAKAGATISALVNNGPRAGDIVEFATTGITPAEYDAAVAAAFAAQAAQAAPTGNIKRMQDAEKAQDEKARAAAETRAANAAKAKAYDDLFNEGAEGYNPYR